MHRKISIYSSVLIIFVLSFIQLDAQQTFTQQEGVMPGIYGSGVANFYFAKPGDFTMLVSVWGAVGRPGRYEIPVGMDIGQLISLAGGPGADTRGTVGVDTYSRRTAGKKIVRLSRLSGNGREIILEGDIEFLLRLKEQTVPLRDGDILMVDDIRRFNFWDIIAIISSSATLLLLFDRIFVIF
jgi:hypothetical protein